MIKKVLSVSMVIITALSMITFSANAAGNMKLEAKSVSASAESGTEVKVPVSFINNPGYGYGYISVTWNHSALELKGVNYTKLAPAQASAAPIENKGWYKVSFGDMLSHDNFKGNGEAFTLVFKVTGKAAAGKYKIDLQEPEVYDKDIVEIEAEASAAEVTLTGGSDKKSQSSEKKTEEKTTQKATQKPAEQSKTDNSSKQSSKESKVKIAAEKPASNAKNGSIVKVPVYFTENTGYSFGSLTAKWDKTALILTDIEYTDLAPEPQHNIPIENNGSFHVLFGKENATENITGTGTAFTLVFKVADAEKAKTSEVSFSDLELLTHDLQEVKAESDKSGITIKNKEGSVVKKSGSEEEKEAEKSTSDSKSGGSPIVFIIIGVLAAAAVVGGVIIYRKGKPSDDSQ